MKVGVPGRLTSAFLTLQLYDPSFDFEIMPFDQIQQAVPDGKVDAGLLIHEGQLTYQAEGLHKIVDLGEWWFERTGGLPLPLGGNVIRRDLGPEMMRTVSKMLHDSIAHALSHRAAAVEYAQQFGRGLESPGHRHVRRHVREPAHARLRPARPRRARALLRRSVREASDSVQSGGGVRVVMWHRGLRTSAVALAIALGSHPLGAQEGAVRVTAPRANVRAEASETSPVLTQVNQGTLLFLIAVEGDWFHVRLAPDPRLANARVEAYISKKVAKLEPATTPPPPGAGRAALPGGPAAVAPVAASRDGMSVALVAGDATSYLSPGTVRVIQVADRVDSLGKLAPALTSTVSAQAPADPSAPLTFIWLVDGPTAARALPDKRPAFVIQFKDVPGVGPDDLIPVIIKLTPAASEARLVAALRGRADQPSRADVEWDVFKDLKQDVIRTDLQAMARGIARIQPSADLAPGEYAVALRLSNGRRKLAGAVLLQSEGEGRVFGAVWDFSIR